MPIATERIAIPPLDQDYWNEPAPQNRGETSADSLYPEVGLLLTEYEQIESALASLFFQFVMRYPFFDAMMHKRRYGSHTRVEARCEEVKDVLECYMREVNLPNDLYQDIKFLIKHIPKAAAIRAKVAHGVVSTITLDNELVGYFLTPTWYNAKQTFHFNQDWWLAPDRNPNDDPFYALAMKHRYVAADLKHFQARFQEISSLLRQMCGKVTQHDVQHRMGRIN